MEIRSMHLNNSVKIALSPHLAPPGLNELKRLPIYLVPEFGESLYSFVRRLAVVHGHRSMNTFLSKVGLRTIGSPFGRPEIVQRISKITGIELSLIEQMTWKKRSSVSGMISVLGIPLPIKFTRLNSMRFCPDCIRIDGVRRDFWSLSYITSCPLHCCRLIESCPSCDRAYSINPHGPPMGCQCGLPFNSVASQRGSDFSIRVAKNIAAMLGVDYATGFKDFDLSVDLAMPFHTINATDFMAYIHVVGTAATTLSQDDINTRGLSTAYGEASTEALEISLATANVRCEAALEILDDWPTKFHSLLAEVEKRTGDIGGDSKSFLESFSTRIGFSLRLPMRGSGGLPLPLVHQEIDSYWNQGHKKKRRTRNFSIKNLTARRLCKSINATVLAKLVGDSHGTKYHGRVLRRVIELLTPNELEMKTDALAELVQDRTVVMYHKGLSLIAAAPAKSILEGGDDLKSKFLGWDHPLLLPPNKVYVGLRFVPHAVYLEEDVKAVLERLRAKVQKIYEVGRLQPICKAIRLGPMRPWYSKTDLLLDIFNDKIRVYSLIVDPRFKDLYIDVEYLNSLSAARNPVISTEHDTGYAPLNRINDRISFEIGTHAKFSVSECDRLLRANLISVERRKSFVINRKRASVERLFLTSEMLDLAHRRFEPSALTLDEERALAKPEDISDLIRERYIKGYSLVRIANELDQIGLRTSAGLKWTRRSLKWFTPRAVAGQIVLGIKYN